MAFVSSLRLDTAGNRRFSGARQVPGADVWLASETSRGLDPDGWMGRGPPRRAPHARKQGCVCGHKSEGCARRGATEKSCQKWYGGSMASCQEPSNGCISYPHGRASMENQLATALAGLTTGIYVLTVRVDECQHGM